jgi:hypothetical protein
MSGDGFPPIVSNKNQNCNDTALYSFAVLIKSRAIDVVQKMLEAHTQVVHCNYFDLPNNPFLAWKEFISAHKQDIALLVEVTWDNGAHSFTLAGDLLIQSYSSSSGGYNVKYTQLTEDFQMILLDLNGLEARLTGKFRDLIVNLCIPDGCISEAQASTMKFHRIFVGLIRQ